MSQSSESLPVHDELSRATRALEAASLVAAVVLVALHVVRIAREPAAYGPWLVAVVAAAWLAADLVSGLVHWTADTWGRQSMPLVGRRFLKPFRVHHVNPADFLRRDFVDCNGDVALLVCPLLLAAWWLPPGLASGFVAALGAAALPTNQVHQWAHMPRPPRPVRWLQRRGLILSREAHARHHTHPHTRNYCITNGWCNAALERLELFARLERAIARLTGVQPRSDS
jgi:ubiquitin-conjugating enzyme E2 variant